jgi:hypothetical protein
VEDVVAVTESGRLRDTLERAVRLGVITDKQAEAILALETGAVEAGAPSEPLPPHARPLHVRAVVAEVLGYVGAALATASAVIVVSQFWADLRPGARVALLGVVAVALWAAGVPLRDVDRPTIARLGSFLWALSAGAFAFCAFLVGEDLLSLEERDAMLLAAWSTTGYAGVLWWRRPLALQQIAAFIGLGFALVATLLTIEQSLESWVGLAVWALGVAWLLLAWGQLPRPVTVAWVLGAIAALWGPLNADIADVRWELLLGLATAAALVAVSVALRRTVLLALGVIGLFVYIPAVVFTFFGDELGAPVALFITGVLLVALALLLARVRPGGSAAQEGERS